MHDAAFHQTPGNNNLQQSGGMFREETAVIQPRMFRASEFKRLACLGNLGGERLPAHLSAERRHCICHGLPGCVAEDSVTACVCFSVGMPF